MRCAYVDKVVAVSENEIAGAILSVLEKQKLVAEGAGAVGIAAAMYGKVDLRGKTVCALLSGGNVDVTMLERIITRGRPRPGAPPTSPRCCRISPKPWPLC